MKLTSKFTALLTTLPVLPAFFALFLAPGHVVAAEQKLCPIMIQDDIDPDEYVKYKGVKVYMCCGSCVKAWNVNPDYFVAVVRSMKKDLVPQLKDVKIPKVTLIEQRFCPLRPDTLISPKSPSVEYKGKKIYFFKERDIARKWKKDPEAHFQRAFKAGLLPQFAEKKKK